MTKKIAIKQWVRRGSMMVATSALDADDPMTPYNQALSQGVKPEEYGLKHPLDEEFENHSRGGLLREIANLRSTIRSVEAWL